MVMAESLVPVIVGIAVGLVLVFGATRPWRDSSSACVSLVYLRRSQAKRIAILDERARNWRRPGNSSEHTGSGGHLCDG